MKQFKIPKQYSTPYSWVAVTNSFLSKPTEDEIKCAWCKKSRAEIRKTEDPIEHIDKHIELEKEIKH